MITEGRIETTFGLEVLLKLTKSEIPKGEDGKYSEKDLLNEKDAISKKMDEQNIHLEPR
jgi:hypothetical protein